MNIKTIGLDIAKTTFHHIGLDPHGKQVLKKKLRRGQLLSYFANLEPCTIAMEGCASSYYWQRELTKLGHRVKLLPAQHVKPHVRGNKNDYNDALAIAEASRVPGIREVRPKTIDQQCMQALHRLREGTVGDRTALINQLRGLLAEFGIIFPRGKAKIKQGLYSVLEDAENDLSYPLREALADKYSQFKQLDEQVAKLDRLIKQAGSEHKEVPLLQSIPGYGNLTSSTFYSEYGNCATLATSRDAGAATGVVPRQHSTGGKTVLLGISKRGDSYLRKMLINGARSVVNHAHKKDDALSVWVTQLVKRRGKNIATVALANKLARIGWAVIVSGKPYEENYGMKTD
jgi:transposase